MAHPVAPPGATSVVVPDTRNSGQLALALADQMSRLVKDEVALAKADVGAAAKRLGAGAGLLAAAGAVALMGLVALLVGGGLGIAQALPSWLSALVVGGGFVLLAAVLGLLGVRALKAAGSPVPTEAIDGLKLDLDIVKQVKP